MEPEMRDIIAITRANTDLISILGALIIFFSWVVSNTLKTNYSNLKNAIAGAERDARIYGALDELAGMVNSVASEIVQPKFREREKTAREENTSLSLYRIAVNEYSRILLTAYQIRECNQFCMRELSLSQAHAKKTVSALTLEATAQEASTLFSKFSDKQVECEELIKRILEKEDSVTEEDYQRATQLINGFNKFTREDAIPRVVPLYDRAVPAGNLRRTELSKIEARLGKYARTFDKLSVWLYIIGSVLALLGKVIEKVIPTA
jgi:hypothetical protein